MSKEEKKGKKSFLEDLGDLFNKHFSEPKETKPKENPLTWQQFIEKTGSDLDELIIDHAKKAGLLYIGGKCQITVTKAEKDKKEFIVNVDAKLYYKDQFKKDKNFQIYPLHTDRSFDEFVLDDEETKAQLEKLKTEQIEFDVAAPQVKNEEE